MAVWDGQPRVPVWSRCVSESCQGGSDEAVPRLRLSLHTRLRRLELSGPDGSLVGPRFAELGLGEVGAAEVGAAQVGVAEPSAAEVGAAQVGAAEIE